MARSRILKIWFMVKFIQILEIKQDMEELINGN